MYNRLYMKDEEVPATTEELYAYMQENTRGGHYGFVEQHSTPYYAAGWINGFGGYILNDAGEPGLNLPETEEALAYHKKVRGSHARGDRVRHSEYPVQRGNGACNHSRSLADPDSKRKRNGRGNRLYACDR